MKIKDWLNTNKDIFHERDLRYILKEVLALDSLFLSEEATLKKDKLDYLEKIKKSYIKGLPLAYILGKDEFFGYEFEIRPSVLIPRKETELIVEEALEIIKANDLKTILDLGCGSGNIAISIKKNFNSNVKVVSSDISDKALEVAQKNKAKHNVDVGLVRSDLLTAFKYRCFDLIISNPPYVERKHIKGSLKYEPRLALQAKNKGLHFIDAILWSASNYLKKEGFLIFEIGYDQNQAVKEIIDDLGCYDTIKWIKDYAGHFRGVILKAKGNG